MKVTIYHNPSCSKSRKALEILKSKPGLEVIQVCYLESGICSEDIINLSRQLNLSVFEMIRTKENQFKALTLDTQDSDACAKAIEQYPKILERPIVVVGESAVIARPPERLEDLF